MEKRNKILIIIIAVLVAAIGITGTFAYQNYRMSQMDSYMKESNKIADAAADHIDHASILINQSKDTEAIAELDLAINDLNKTIDKIQKARNIAPTKEYQDLLDMSLKKQRVLLEIEQSWKQRILLTQQGEYYNVMELKNQENERINDWKKYNDEYESIKSKNPGMQEHIDKFWQ